ncbi:MAG: S-methyl-5-thioribose-1-phosphate isomerase [Omnitrophica WOR_2 bacterium GWA2_53_43]|nr:MAG: S-methyl-5-thioribose-1-phosphate isomerase [Omnitrophica WOR_2 bacterium GWA2_53_43]
MSIQTISWVNGHVKLIDQTKLPHKLEYIHCRDVKRLWQAIRRLSVRGAPALGVAAAFGVLLGIKSFSGNDRKRFLKHVERVSGYIATSRPTAVNLFNALARMKQVIQRHPGVSVAQLKNILKKEALAIYEEDRKLCRKMGDFGAALIKNGASILTVCNAGALATVDYGTALGVMYTARKQGKKFQVYACETRPLLQGARLTVWELLRSGIDTTLICDNMAATLMKQGKIDAVFTGADRIAANGDTANKIGTYMLAVLAKHHGVPFYVVAPQSTFDLAIADGKQIPIEERSREEVLGFGGCPTAPRGVNVYNPAFDVTDHKLITAIVTEKGIIRRPFYTNIKKIFKVSRKG